MPDHIYHTSGVHDHDLFNLSREPALLPDQFGPLLEELQDLRELDEQFETLEREKQELVSELEDAEREIKDLKDQIDALTDENRNLKADLADT